MHSLRYRSHKLIALLTVLALLGLILAGCGQATTTSSGGQAPTAGQLTQAAGAGQVTQDATVEPAQTTVTDLPASVSDDLQDHTSAEAAVLEGPSPTPIALNGDSIAVSGAGATAIGGTLTITAPGVYRLSGSLADGQVVVNVQQDGIVGLILDGVDIRCSTGPAVYILNAQEAVIILADSSKNHLSDGATRAAAGTDDDPTAAVFSMADLTLSGTGSLVVDGSYQDGIAAKDGLVVISGALTISARDDGIRGKDYLIVRGGSLTVTAGGDGLKSDNDTDAARGYVLIENGSLAVTAGGDAIQAQTAATIVDGQLALTSGGGHSGSVAANTSAKGIKGVGSVTIEGGTLTIDSADDALHSNGSIVVNSGTLVLSSGDDGMHADETLAVNGGDIEIAVSYEGVESAAITISGGYLSLVAADDGINGSSGNDGSGLLAGPGRGGPGQDAFSGDCYLHIDGGTLVVNAAGDGIDINGPIEMTGGVVLVSGPTESMNGALDYLGEFSISGGLLVAAGSAGMAEAPSASSDQPSLMIGFNGTARAGSLIHIETSDGEEVLTFAPAKEYQTLVFSSPQLARGDKVTIFLGGSSSAPVSGGLYQAGGYSGGSEYATVTLSDVVTWVGTRQNRRW